MSQKKQKKGGAYDGTRETEARAASASLSTLGDVFGGAFSADPRARKKAAKAIEAPVRITQREEPALIAASTPVAKGPRVLSYEEAMAEAVAQIDKGQVFDGKYLGLSGFDTQGIVIYDPSEEDSQGAEIIPFEELGPVMSAEEILFSEAMAGSVKRLAVDHRLRSLRQHDWVGAQWHDEYQLDHMSNNALFEPSLTGDQRVLLKRSRKARVRELSVRLQTLGDAMSAVQWFIRTCVRDGDTFARIITGKGKQSSEGPVLKPAVIKWCNGDGKPWIKGWAPETDVAGQFGSIVVELRKPRD
jgi:DNA-nicking Smr family endonuclease